MVFDGFDHDFVLQGGRCHLHAAGAADGRVGDVAVAGDLVAGIDDDDPFFFAEDARGFAQQGCLADAGPAQQQKAAAAHDDIVNDVDDTVDGAADATGEADDDAFAIADG